MAPMADRRQNTRRNRPKRKRKRKKKRKRKRKTIPIRAAPGLALPPCTVAIRRDAETTGPPHQENRRRSATKRRASKSAIEAAQLKSLDASGGSVFLNLID